MFAALRAHFQEWRTVKRAQGMRFDNPPQPQHTGSMADRRHGDAIPMQLEARVPSPPETTDARELNSNTNTNGDADVLTLTIWRQLTV
jgi:hypothetical protein